MVIGSRCYTCAKQIGMLINCFNCVYEKSEEHQVRLWITSRRKQIFSGIGAHAPVVVLAAAVDACIRFFMKQYFEIMSASHFIHQVHKQLVMVNSQVYLFKQRSTFKLTRCYFIVTCFKRNA